MSIAIIAADHQAPKETEVLVEETRTVECFVCEQQQQVPSDSAREETIYNNPHANNGENIHLCDDCHLEDENHEFAYWLCSYCDRYICQRNPGNGYQGWFKRDVLEDLMCCACYQTKTLKDGQPREEFMSEPSGYHYLQGEFYDDADLEQAGYSKVPKFIHVKMTRAQSADYCEHADKLCGRGAAVVTQYQNLSILGDEGYVTMWSRGPSDPSGLPGEDVRPLKRCKSSSGDECDEQ